MPIQIIKTKPEFVDERGYITRLIDQDKYRIRAVLYITSKKGTIRGNHYHKKDAHYVYCLRGKFKYSEKDMSRPRSRVQHVILEPGDVVLSQPMHAHSMEFLKNTVFMAFTTEAREQDKYEKDTVRVKIV